MYPHVRPPRVSPQTAFEHHREVTSAARMAVLEGIDEARAEHVRNTTLFSSIEGAASALAEQAEMAAAAAAEASEAEGAPSIGLDTAHIQASADAMHVAADDLLDATSAQLHRTGPGSFINQFFDSDVAREAIMVFWSQPIGGLGENNDDNNDVPRVRITKEEVLRDWSRASKVELCSMQCSICMEGATEKEDEIVVKVPRCGHMFHVDCLNKWLMRGKDTCPNCRACMKR